MGTRTKMSASRKNLAGDADGLKLAYSVEKLENAPTAISRQP
jgi:hypothetical protein